MSFEDNQRYQINIAICGAVSAGKSTLLNSLFVSQYSDMKIKRTTMTPQVYYESNKMCGYTRKPCSHYKDLNLKHKKIYNYSILTRIN